MATEADWEAELDDWLAPFLERFRHKKQRMWAPYYVRGLIAPGERKSVEPIAERVCPGETQQLHHFVSTSQWDTAPLEEELMAQVDRRLGGEDAHLIIDDTALVKKGKHSVGVAHQYCGELGKKANCQVLVSLTLAHREIPTPLALDLFLPESWVSDAKRRKATRVPPLVFHRPKWQIALGQIQRALDAGVRAQDVLADAGYGNCSDFRHGLSELGLTWTVGILSNVQVYPDDVTLTMPPPHPHGSRPRKHPVPSIPSTSVAQFVEALGPKAFRKTTWRTGTKGPLSARFATVRVIVADGVKASKGVTLPGESAWLICEQRPKERRYYLSNLPADAGRQQLAASVKARWACELAHQQMKQELGLDHFEGRSWNGLHHHALLTMIAFAFLQQARQSRKKQKA